MYLVTGATGSLGRRIVKQLRSDDQLTRAFVRLSSKFGELSDRGADIFIGDLKQERDIEKACRDINYIISSHGSGNDPQALDYRANIDLIDQAIANNVEHFVFISVLGVDRGYEDSVTFKAKREVEKYLINSGLSYTILRPSGFANNLIPLAERFRDTGIYLSIGEQKNRSSIVSTDDLATIAIASCQIEAAKNQIFAVGGPDSLKREDIPRIFSRLFDREPIVINPPLQLFDGLRAGVGLINPQLNKSLGTLRTLLAHEFYCTPEEIFRLESTFAIEMESLESFLRRYVGQS
ncbi:SDR family oxidoreductase [Waterburya agarophytonicola K14]|uniref:SDR family oxidoreductase n=1 Tax=Waterburya agarophytonicola KI4 TaxID=2874699 RepID=A0A964BPA3_9CYAN|nr:SDR family oxidoreductase [Waterburya agarophytonicola]MCC0176003.1 SDR family oxidoreductase [Waterburya agarophytonicola KI4]